MLHNIQYTCSSSAWSGKASESSGPGWTSKLDQEKFSPPVSSESYGIEKPRSGYSCLSASLCRLCSFARRTLGSAFQAVE
ncbi:hypothetical protein CBOM_08117 [Ceraceosorus bombacis]|uniref:Uncharacterized protein n=1 Tax=Ceraceosorus bombacis TaxID=401625 RepID=A0A0P1B760_9BASI|nr:hypothetical protein CBOM_08117 [Ceraceosorus bombacis]